MVFLRFLSNNKTGARADNAKKILTDDLAKSEKPATSPKIKATSSLNVFTSRIERKKIQIKPAFTAESTRARRS